MAEGSSYRYQFSSRFAVLAAFTLPTPKIDLAAEKEAEFAVGNVNVVPGKILQEDKYFKRNIY
jgi:hypothetical protein